MKANSKRKVFGDAVDLLMGDMEETLCVRIVVSERQLLLW